MYLRPRSLAEKFLVHEKVTTTNEIGRVMVKFVPTGEEILGILSRADYIEKEKFQSTHHETSHFLVSRFKVKAKIGDMLVKCERKFLVQAVEVIGNWVNYELIERKDL